jgi:error-prone DNA polymerase
MLNAQPMGFYSASTLVEDGKRHGVDLRPLDVTVSEWDCAMEGDAVRMGLRYLGGLAEKVGRRILDARAAAPFGSLADFVARTGVDERTVTALAESGGLDAFGGSRRDLLWRARGHLRQVGDSLPLPADDRTPGFTQLAFRELVSWDYRTTSHSPRGHPLAPLRPALAAQGLPDARTVATMRDGQRIRYAGLVICRQRPGTASGTVFMTLEDETGFVNVVLWSRVFQEYPMEARLPFLGITGKLQVQQSVVHLVAEKLWAPTVPVAPVSPGSRDFH